MLLFQFTPPRGRRPAAGSKDAINSCFNSRLRVGGDVSCAFFVIMPSSFNSRLRVGGDQNDETEFRVCTMFQFTPPRGRRPCNSGSFPLPCCFNSRLRVGGDPFACNERYTHLCFNSRLRVGGDSLKSILSTIPICFNSRLRVGGDKPSNIISLFNCGFNSRLRVGGDQILTITECDGNVSIHASAWEATERM